MFTNIKTLSKDELSTLLISLLYLLILSVYTYANAYLPTGNFIAISGRYLLPVVPPFILSLTKIMEKKLNNNFLKVTLVFFSILFIISDYALFKNQIGETWTTKWYKNTKNVTNNSLDYLDTNTHTGDPHGWDCIECI
jgi:hypothetical protein